MYENDELTAPQVMYGGDLIAKYLEAKVAQDKKEGPIYFLPGTNCGRTWYELKYEKSWDRLIPVWSNIFRELMISDVSIYTKYHTELIGYIFWNNISNAFTLAVAAIELINKKIG